jgi:hypothetical protein
MKSANVVLVVPRAYHVMYPPEFRSELLSVSTFIEQLREKYCS